MLKLHHLALPDIITFMQQIFVQYGQYNVLPPVHIHVVGKNSLMIQTEIYAIRDVCTIFVGGGGGGENSVFITI